MIEKTEIKDPDIAVTYVNTNLDRAGQGMN